MFIVWGVMPFRRWKSNSIVTSSGGRRASAQKNQVDYWLTCVKLFFKSLVIIYFNTTTAVLYAKLLIMYNYKCISCWPSHCYCRANHHHFQSHPAGCYSRRECCYSMPGVSWSLSGREIHLVFQWAVDQFWKPWGIFWKSWWGMCHSFSVISFYFQLFMNF